MKLKLNRLKTGLKMPEVFHALMGGFEDNEKLFAILIKLQVAAEDHYRLKAPLFFFAVLDSLTIYEHNIVKLYDLCKEDAYKMLQLLHVAQGMPEEGQIYIKLQIVEGVLPVDEIVEHEHALRESAA